MKSRLGQRAVVVSQRMILKSVANDQSNNVSILSKSTWVLFELRRQEVYL